MAHTVTAAGSRARASFAATAMSAATGTTRGDTRWAPASQATRARTATSVPCSRTDGARFLSLKTEGELRRRARATAGVAGLLAILALACFFAWTLALPQAANRAAAGATAALALALVALSLYGTFGTSRAPAAARELRGFLAHGLAVALVPVFAFTSIFSRVMVSSLDPAWSLTIANASSGDYTLRVMSVVALAFVPVLLAYQAWAHWVFRRRLSVRSRLEY